MGPPNWFIALPVAADALPPCALDALPDCVRRFHPDDLHVTLAFLGPVSRQAALAAWALLDWSAQAPLQGCTGRRAAFGPRRRPSAYGLEIDSPGDRLNAFIARWRDPLLARAGRPPERRPPRAHVTLGRPPRRHSDTIRLREWLATRDRPRRLTLDHVALYTRAAPGNERRFAIVRAGTLAGPTDLHPETDGHD